MRRRRRLLSCPDFLIANCCGPFVCLLASSCGTSLSPISLSLIFSVTHGPVPLNFFLSNLCPFCCKLQNFGNLRGNLWSYFGRYYKSVIYRSVSFMDRAPGLENISSLWRFLRVFLAFDKIMKLLWHTSNLSQHNILGKNENLLNPFIILSELWPMATI